MSSKISLLPAAAALTGPEIIPGVQAGGNVGITADQVGDRTKSRFGVQKNNVTATDPVVGSDNTVGYAAGSVWLNTATGVAFVCIDASTGAAIWLSTSPMDHVGMVSGRYYLPANASLGSSSSVVANALLAIPFRAPHKLSIDRLGMRLNSGVAGNVALGIYSNVNSAPSALLGQTNSLPSTGIAADITSDFTTPIALNPGMYWITALFSASVAVLGAYDRCMGAQVGGTSTTNQLGSGAAYCMFSAALAYGTGVLPATFTGGGGPLAAWAPGIFFRKA